MIKTTTYIFGALVFVFVFLLRDKKKVDHDIQKHKLELERQKAINDSAVKELYEIEAEFVDRIKELDNKIDSLKDHAEAQEHRIKVAKEKLSDEETNIIFNAPDSVILRILSEH